MVVSLHSHGKRVDCDFVGLNHGLMIVLKTHIFHPFLQKIYFR